MENRDEVNTTKRLVAEFNFSILDIALKTGAASRTVERWLREGRKPIPAHQKELDLLLNEAQRDRAKRKAEVKG